MPAKRGRRKLSGGEEAGQEIRVTLERERFTGAEVAWIDVGGYPLRLTADTRPKCVAAVKAVLTYVKPLPVKWRIGLAGEFRDDPP